jgi:hypothetical protein
VRFQTLAPSELHLAAVDLQCGAGLGRVSSVKQLGGGEGGFVPNAPSGGVSGDIRQFFDVTQGRHIGPLNVTGDR